MCRCLPGGPAHLSASTGGSVMKPLASFDRRTFGRRQTDIKASVRVGYRVIPCIIKDLSEGGALLEFAEQTDLPVRLWLSWPEQKSEIVCEVRHTRRNTAGVQFTRPQQMGLRPAVEPGEQFAVIPLATPSRTVERVQAATGSDLVAERRRAIRQPTALVPEPIAAVGSAHAEPPRDISMLMISLRKAAASIVEARMTQAVPRPLAAAQYGGGVVACPGPASVAKVPMPLAACEVAWVPTQPPSIWSG